MIPYKPFPHIDLGFFKLHTYGIFAALGFYVATRLACREAQRRGIDENHVHNLAVWLIIAGLLGARLGYVLFYWPADLPVTFLGVLKIWEGGLAWFGGFLAATVAALLYVKRKQLDFWQYADIFTIPLVVGHIFGRIGDYVMGGHPGKVTALPWAIWLEGASRHPVVLYELLGLAIILLVLMQMRNKLLKGGLFLAYVVLYSVQRFTLDFFRIETTDPRFLGLTPSQLLVIALFAGAAVLLYRRHTITARAALA